MAFIDSSLWAPDIVIESNGIACGDKLGIYAHREGRKIYFSFHGDVCKVCRAVSEYIEDSFSGMEESEISKELYRLKSGKYLNSELWIQDLETERKNCVNTPIALALLLIGKTDSCDTSDRQDDLLACDACVRVRKVNWDSSPCKENDETGQNRKIAVVDDPVETELQKYGICVLNEKDRENFKARMRSIDARYFKKIMKLRLSAPFYNNAARYGAELPPEVSALAIKQSVSLAVAETEISVINKFIEKRGLCISAVKGERTKSFYPENEIRAHMDFDYLALDCKDAFVLIDFLINSRKFLFVTGGSVPFSFKAVIDADGEERLTGHIHLEKILQDHFQVIVDINMGGFPVGRTGLITCRKGEKLSIEDLACITVSHMFKHEHVFVKDINDLYYMLSDSGFNKDKFLQKLQKFGLYNYFCVVYNFMRGNMGLTKLYPCNGDCEMLHLAEGRWPYSRIAHFKIKVREEKLFNCERYGNEDGAMETEKQVRCNQGVIKSIRYNALSSTLNTRKYLYPMMVFNKYMEFGCTDSIVFIEPYMGIYNDILVLPVGLFLIVDECRSQSRAEIRDELDCLMDNLNINESMCNFSYIMEARRDLWLY